MIVEKIIPIAREAGKLMVRSGFDVMEKDTAANLVTSSDLAVQHFLVDQMTNRCENQFWVFARHL